MYRFKVSKYKNAAPKIPKKEKWITEIPCGRIMGSCGDFVTVSANHIAFNVESGSGGCAGILPLGATGRYNRKVPTIYAHAEFLTDMCFSPFDDDLLATCSYDGTIKLWDIPKEMGETLDNPLINFTPDEVQKKLDILRFHPTADEVLSCAAFDAINIIDLNVGETKYCIENGKEAQFQSSTWRLDGTMMATSAKDTKYRIIDPRNETISMEFQGFEGNKDSRLVWLGNTDYIFGTGFTKSRERQMGIWDVRNTSSMIFNEDVDRGSGCLMPFHDIDTNMIILAGKGDNYVSLYEFNESSKTVTMSSVESLSSQTFGMGLTPKRVLDVMNGEVDRLYQLCKNMVVQVPYIIPRKSYRDFQPDLFPETVYSGKAPSNASEWFTGVNKEVIKLDLDPKVKTSKPIVSGLKSRKRSESSEALAKSPPKQTSSSTQETSAKEPEEKPSTVTPATVETKEDKPTKVGLKHISKTNKPVKDATSAETMPVESKKAAFSVGYQPKFKHLLGELVHKKVNIENIKNLSEALPSESDGLQAYKDFVAVPLIGAGGQVAVFQLSKPGRLPESEIPVLQNGCGVLDFAMDPFNHQRIAVGCDDWSVKIWEIPADGLTETLSQPIQVLKGHKQRVTIVKFHPTAKDILVSASLDMSIVVWDLSDYSEIGALEGHTDQILALSWHPDGKYLATFSKDKTIRVYDPVEDLEPMKEGTGPTATRGARLCWCGPNNNWLAISVTFGSGRDIYLYDDNFKEVCCAELEDTSPSVLSLCYDESTNVLFATGKGDRNIYAFEVNDTEPYLHRVSMTNFKSLHQGIAILQKDMLDVRKVEFAKAARLTKSSIELVSFTLPRVKVEYFQDDIFPDTRISWQPTLASAEWLNGDMSEVKKMSLKPNDMIKLSEAPKEAPKAAKYSSKDILSEKSDEEKKSELIGAMMGKLDVDHKLEQDHFEGVDEDEWDEE